MCVCVIYVGHGGRAKGVKTAKNEGVVGEGGGRLCACMLTCVS